MPPLATGRRYSFMTPAGRLEGEVVSLADDWITVKLARGDMGYFRASSLVSVVETDHLRNSAVAK